MAWLRGKGKKRAEPAKGGRAGWKRCGACGEIVEAGNLARNLRVCPECGHHERLHARERLRATLDEGSFSEFDAGVTSCDPLRFRGRESYPGRLRRVKRETGENEAVICGEGSVEGQRGLFAFFEMAFLGGSMGSAVGEKVTRLVERGVETRTPVVIFTASGGARMQEGILSLMQMAKVSAALARLRFASVPYIGVLTDPTTGGVCASMGMLGDVILAEPGALIGFAGPRVIEEMIEADIPPDLQRSETLLANGLIDRVVERRALRPTLARLLGLLVPPPAPVRTA